MFTDLRGGMLCISNYRTRLFAVAKCRKADARFPGDHPARSTAHRGISGGVCRVNVKAVQRMLGHAKASMTLDVYADLFDEDLDGVADRLDAAIKSAADRPHILVAGHRSALTQSGWRDSNPRPLRPER